MGGEEREKRRGKEEVEGEKREEKNGREEGRTLSITFSSSMVVGVSNLTCPNKEKKRREKN